MNSLYEAVQVAARDVACLNRVVQVDGDGRRSQHPASLVIELIRAADAHRNDGRSNLMCHDESTLLKWTHMTVHGARTLRKNDHADPILDMASNPFECFLELGGPASATHGDIAKPLHHPTIGRNLKMRIQFQPAYKLRNCGINDKCIKQIDVVTDENAGALRIESRAVLHLKSDAGQAQNVAKEPSLRPVVPARIDEDSKDDQ